MGVLKNRIQEDSLILSLEFSLQMLQQKEEKCVELFYLIGITKEGLFEDDLEQLFEEEDTLKGIEALLELSLIQQESLDQAGKLRRYKVSPFLDKYVQHKLALDSNRDFNMFLAYYYSNRLFKLKKEYQDTED
mmetsp:Transcript_8254/g.6152  ORF Transcript_8254/g.6152 Transcript_8254/m.6152 type:complete len:133 (-) Transcript_8254:76-474(-)